MGTHKDFGYYDAKHVYSWAIVNSRLLGQDRIVSNTESIRTSPYRLFVSIYRPTSPSSENCSVLLKSLKIVTHENQTIAVLPNKNEKFEKSPEGYKAIFTFDDMKLEYEDYILHLSASVIGCEESHEIEIKLFLNRNYQEDKISLWDKLMGV